MMHLLPTATKEVTFTCVHLIVVNSFIRNHAMRLVIVHGVGPCKAFCCSSQLLILAVKFSVGLLVTLTSTIGPFATCDMLDNMCAVCQTVIIQYNAFGSQSTT